MQRQLIMHNVSKVYQQSHETIEIFRNLSMTFEQGSSYAIMGPSGSGKSTCLHMLTGIDAPTEGYVSFANHNLSLFSPRQALKFLREHISLVFQQPALLEELTVLDNVMLKRILAGPTTETDHMRAKMLLDQVYMLDKAYSYPPQLSGGQQQRVAILRALFVLPEFMLVDEPTGNLDEQVGQDVISLLLTYQKQYNMGLIMTTHNPQLAYQMQHVLQVEDYTLKKM